VPTITATADNVKSQVRLDLDFSDIDAPYALVNRVDVLTGATTQVRGHGSSVTVGTTAYAPMQAGYKAVLYDTEAPLDQAFYYTATAPVGTLNVNTTFAGGYTDPWYVTNQLVTMRITSNGSGQNFLSFNSDGTVNNPQVQAEDIPATPGATITVTAVLSCNISKQFNVGMNFRDATGAILSSPSITVPAILTATTVVATGTAPANTVTVQPYVQMTGTPLATTIGSASSVVVSNAAGSATSAAVQLQSLGACWLKDPLRPGNNVRVDFLFDPNPQCTPTEGVFWQSLDSETYAANSAAFNINNQAFPVVVSKIRSAMTSTLTLVSRTFADRDRLKVLFAPGSPVLFQVPDQYALPDMFISIGGVQIARVLPDHAFPIRVFSLPFTATAGPGGFMQGTVGARWQDTCNRYATWGAVNAAGLTWTQVLDGLAG
jgi:hypothetical protein